MTKIVKVLVIDSDRGAAEVVRDNLECLGYQVTVCSSGEEALRCSENESFDFIITDHNIPGMKGLEMARKMRQRFPGAYLIGVSGSDMCDAFFFAGANWYINKPVTFQKLQSVFRDRRNS